jgi:hypothetical protein
MMIMRPPQQGHGGSSWDPFSLAQRREVRSELVRILESAEIGEELQLAGSVHGFKTEHAGEHAVCRLSLPQQQQFATQNNAGRWASSTLALYETTCLGALHEQSGEGVVSPLNHSGAQALQFELAPPGC